MNQNYKKFKDRFSEEGQKEFYSKIESMKKNLKELNPSAKKSIQKNIETIIQSYEKMKKYYFECVDFEKKIKEKNICRDKLDIDLFNKKMKFVQKSGYMFRDSFDKKFGLSNN